MADQDRDQQSRKNRNPDNSQSGGQGEQDDVAEDRNLSGSSTWLTLPDQQPRGDSDADSDDTNDRQSKR